VDPIKVYFTVSEPQYLSWRRRFPTEESRLQADKELRLQLILADGSTYPHEGKFYFADRQVNETTGAIRLAGLFSNPNNILRPGGYAKVRAVIRTQPYHDLYESSRHVVHEAGYKPRTRRSRSEMHKSSYSSWVRQSSRKLCRYAIASCSNPTRSGERRSTASLSRRWSVWPRLPTDSGVRPARRRLIPGTPQIRQGLCGIHGRQSGPQQQCLPGQDLVEVLRCELEVNERGEYYNGYQPWLPAPCQATCG
jgi:hypothetical protein